MFVGGVVGHGGNYFERGTELRYREGEDEDELKMALICGVEEPSWSCSKSRPYLARAGMNEDNSMVGDEDCDVRMFRRGLNASAGL